MLALEEQRERILRGSAMIAREPIINVGVVEGYAEIQGSFRGEFSISGRGPITGQFSVRPKGEILVLADGAGEEVARGAEIRCHAGKGSTFVLRGVTIGVKFHWERKEDQTFEGDLKILRRKDGTLTAVNLIPLEAYLRSVISSEMSAEAPLEFLRAHAITSRSWLVAMLERTAPQLGPPAGAADGEIIRWYTREDHDQYDVCADDHCQRYQGITKILSPVAIEAVTSTHGVFLVYDGTICDARFYKACGGLTEEFQNAWEDVKVPYLTSIADAPVSHPPVRNERDAEHWIRSQPEAYCNTMDSNILRQILPSFDLETMDFFRWKVAYSREELEKIIREKSGIDFGTLMDLVPLVRGPSGRMVKLRVVGTGRTIVVGKDLEIRRWLSPSHLYSSAFVVDTERDTGGRPLRFVLRGAGWGHGVGLCQIGAAVMAIQGFGAHQIVRHYFRGAEVRKIY
jgi:SpoIID/LytB domain protein